MVFPKGFALNASHRRHITLIQRFVRTADLYNVYAVAGKALADASMNNTKLEAFKLLRHPSQYLSDNNVHVPDSC